MEITVAKSFDKTMIVVIFVTPYFSCDQHVICYVNSASVSRDSPFVCALTDKPAFSNVSTLPNIPAPQFSAVSPLQPPGRSPGRDRLDSSEAIGRREEGRGEGGR